VLRRLVLLSGAALAGVALAFIACFRQDDLGVDTSSSSSSSSAGGAPAPGPSGSGGAPATSGAGGDAGPSGPTSLTIVNGINDYDAVRFCFLPGDTPWPGLVGGLPFGTGQVVDLTTALPAGVDVTPWVFAGDLAAVTGMTCTDILALAGAQVGDGGAPPPIVAAALGVVPQVVLASDQSLLLVPTGCMGGSGHDSANAATACGMGYTSTTPTTGVVLLSMSRLTNPGHLALQVVNGSAVMPVTDVGFQLNLTAKTQVVVASSLGPGAVEPGPPFTALAAADFGPLAGVQIDTYPPGGSTATSSVLLGGVLSASAVGTAGFADGQGLALVAVGSAPGLPAGPFWHTLTYALVSTSP
jgi:hypothetical protein